MQKEKSQKKAILQKLFFLFFFLFSFFFSLYLPPIEELGGWNGKIEWKNPDFRLFSTASYCILPTIFLTGVLALIVYRRSLFACFGQCKKYLPLVGNLVSRDLKVKYRRSILGFFWSILNPLLMALVINAVFSRVFRSDIQYFAVYYLSGALIFNFLTEATSGSLSSVIDASALIKKVYLPKYVFCFQKCVFAVINMLFGSVAVIVVMLIQGCPFRPTMFLFFVPMFYAFLFAFGFGLFLSAITVFFRDMLHLYGVFTMIWMYLTPIFYPESLLLNNGLKIVMKLNPAYYLTHMFREVVMYGTLPSVSEQMVCLSFAAVFLLLGSVTLQKLQDRFVLYL